MLRILVPSDGSPNSQYGVRHVVSEFVKNRDLEIHVLNVQAPFSKHIGRFTSRRSRIEFHQEHAEKALKPVRQAARRLQCHRIVMGTARENLLIRWAEDSVTNKVTERTTVPVQVIAGDAASGLERVGIPAGVGAGLLVLWIAAD